MCCVALLFFPFELATEAQGRLIWKITTLHLGTVKFDQLRTWYLTYTDYHRRPREAGCPPALQRGALCHSPPAYGRLLLTGRCEIGSTQVLGSFDVAYDIPWPSSLLNLINAANFVNIPVLYLPGLSCLYPRMQVYQVTYGTHLNCDHILLVSPIITSPRR
jgi:hypothetical protein